MGGFAAARTPTTGLGATGPGATGLGAVTLAVVADVHIDASFSWAEPALGRKLRQCIRDALRRAVARAGELGVDAFLVAGDLFEDGRYAPDTPEYLRKLFSEIDPIPVLLAPGNHDFAGPASPYRSVVWGQNVHLFSDTRLSPFELADGPTIWGACHDRPAGTPGFFDSGFEVARGGVHLALFHGAERGSLFMQDEGKELHAPFEESQVAAAGISHAFVGHYHVPRDTDALTYPGNLEHLAFGEQGERALVIAEVAGTGAVTAKREVLADVGMYDAVADATGCETVDAVRDRVAEALSTLPASGQVRVARVSVVGEMPADIELTAAGIVDVRNDLDAVLVRSIEVRPSYDVEQIAGEATVRGAYVRLVRDAGDLAEDERDLVMLAGLRALDGRNDLEVL
ncbi:MAG: metallophosphoesterase family protein [Acidimicrobiales bacterium]